MNPAFITANVRPADRGTFFVRSSEGTKEWFVDLLSYHSAGQCSCPDYRCRREAKNAALGPNQPGTPSRCRHIHAARQFACDLLLMGLERQETP